METIREKKHIFGVLSYEKMMEVFIDERMEIVKENAKTILTSSVAGVHEPVIGEKDTNKYEITADYTLIDTKLNKHGHILAELLCQRVKGELVVQILSYRNTKKN